MFMPKWPPYYKKSGKIMEILSLLDNPHLKLPPTIHVAGTNGKGSTIAFMKQILQEHNLNICSFTTPHLLEFNECFEVNNQHLNDSQIDRLTEEIKLKLKNQIEPSFFEFQAALAFLSFSRSNADICIIECGMGAKNDPTNILPSPLLSVITPISFDHEEFLGASLEEITIDKCHIIKRSPVISAAQNEISNHIIREFSKLQNTTLHNYNESYDFSVENNKLIYADIKNNELIYYNLPSLNGEHQIINLVTAITAIKAQSLHEISDATINKAIEKTKWPGRLEKLSASNNQEIWFDGAHNPAGAMYLSKWLIQNNNSKICLIYGRSANKNHADFLKYFLNKNIDICFVTVENEAKAESTHNFKKFCTNNIDYQNIRIFDNLTIMFNDFLPGSKYNIILVCGSLFLYRDLKNNLQQKKPPKRRL